MRRVLVASFGFDIDFVVRKLATGEFRGVVLLALYTGEEAYRRVEKAYHTLSVVCRSLDVECRIERVEPDKLLRSVLSIVRSVTEDPEAEAVTVYLTGGPRILVAALIMSTLLLPAHLAGKVELLVEGEGFDCELKVDLSRIIELVRLDERDKRIFFELEAKGPQRLGELEDNTGVPRATLYRRLEGLEGRKLVRKEEDRYVAEEVAVSTCRTE